ncbi:MAG TPA: hypothetical protein VFE88_00665 [Candidatus Nanoarchaeia archaeon]|nr:hypothetical protein [Candidatus Nanoarchaeia archaeon]
MDLVACLSTGKGTWGHVSRMIAEHEWDSIFLVCNEFGKENFHPEKKANFVIVDSRRGTEELRNDIKGQLQNHLKGTEVAVNLISGIGKEHMAILSALLQLGFGIRFLALTKDGVKEI